eukprot:1160390-Pelagomonas_calceolata.AAC.15
MRKKADSTACKALSRGGSGGLGASQRCGGIHWPHREVTAFQSKYFAGVHVQGIPTLMPMGKTRCPLYPCEKPWKARSRLRQGFHLDPMQHHEDGKIEKEVRNHAWKMELNAIVSTSTNA